MIGEGGKTYKINEGLASSSSDKIMKSWSAGKFVDKVQESWFWTFSLLGKQKTKNSLHTVIHVQNIKL